MSSDAQSGSYPDTLTLIYRELSRATSLDRVMEIVRTHTRNLTGADGVTFVLKDGPNCYYADEDAIGPLWKGRRFPQTSCISGWVMMYRKPAVIEDIFVDPRIPAEVYRATFVRSLVMVPVGEHTPIAAIGNYWAENVRASAEQVATLQWLAAHTGLAMSRIGAAQREPAADPTIPAG